MQQLAPLGAAMPDDYIGLQIPGPQTVEKILLSLDVDARVVNEAKKRHAGLIVAHHPVIHQSLDRISNMDLAGQVIISSIRNEIGIYIAHTNLDCAPGGVNDVLAELLELRNMSPLQATGAEKKYKLVTFVPEAHVDKVRTAMCEAGGGHIGEYSYCTFQTPGAGTFMPSQKATPFLGSIGKINKEAELRLEVLIPAKSLAAVIDAMKAAHPYEEVAYDVYELAEPGRRFGMGRVGDLPKAMSLRDYAGLVKRRLGVKRVRVIGREGARLKRVAVCGGSGGNLLSAVVAEGAQAFVTGEMKYHQMLAAGSLGLCVVEAGHGATERVALPVLAERLRQMLPDVEVILSRVQTDRSDWI
jgi:dinuclear metal center YbgI/SA1388 family protein